MEGPIYIASDFHLGLDLKLSSKEREAIIVSWLDEIKKDAYKLVLLGDVFDFWFEYKNIVPRGHARLIAKLAELSELGIEIIMFTGNHDMWLFDYFEEEINAIIYRDPVLFDWNDKKILMGHGDGLGPGDSLYKLIRKIFRNPICQWLFRRIHPNTAIQIMKYCSKKSRESKNEDAYSENKERLIKYVESHPDKDQIDYFVFGHRHIPIKYLLSNQSSYYFNSGDWMNHFSYLVFKESILEMQFFKRENPTIYGNC